MFKKIYVEITNKCNLKCSFCSKTNRMIRDMSVNEFAMVINKIKLYTDTVYLHIKGEPLLHPNLDDILTICDRNSINVKITTNGTRLSKCLDILLNHPIKQLNISLHSENTMSNYFESVFKACDILSKSITIVYRIWVLEDMKFDALSTNIVNKIISNYHLNSETVNFLYEKKNTRIANNIYLDKDNAFVWPNDSLSSTDFSNHGYCLGTRTHIGILSDGTIIPCCLDSDGFVNLGNIFNDEMVDIINKPLFKAINCGFRNGKVVCELCQKCTFRRRFK